jgi:putative flippase GtrA
MLTSPKVRYLIVGGACAATYNAIMIGGDFLGLHYVVSTLVSYVVVVALGFVLHSTFTFSQTPSRPGFVRYALAMAANLPISVVLMFCLVTLGGLPVALAAPLCTVIMIAWNYGASHWAIRGWAPWSSRRGKGDP